MNRSVPAAVVLLALLLLNTDAAAEHSTYTEANGLHYYFATANDTVVFGDVMPIDWVVTNVSGDSMFVHHPCNGISGSFGYQIWAPGPPADPTPRVICGCCGCSPAIYTDWPFEPGEEYTRYFVRNTDTFSRPGNYTLEGWFNAWTVIGGEDVWLNQTLTLDFVLWGGPTGAAEFEGTWSTIKALYR